MTKKKVDLPDLDEEGKRFVCSLCEQKIEQAFKLPSTGWVCENCYFGRGFGEEIIHADDE